MTQHQKVPNNTKHRLSFFQADPFQGTQKPLELVVHPNQTGTRVFQHHVPSQWDCDQSYQHAPARAGHPKEQKYMGKLPSRCAMIFQIQPCHQTIGKCHWGVLRMTMWVEVISIAGPSIDSHPRTAANTPETNMGIELAFECQYHS